MPQHRLIPRFRYLAYLAMLAGAASLAATAMGWLPAATGLAAAVIGALLGVAYLRSPSWRNQVITDDAGLRVQRGEKLRFELSWDEVRRVVASDATSSCFVDGGSPERSLLVPGDGAPASYDITDRRALFDTIVTRVAAERIAWVETLETFDASSEAGQDPTPAPPT